MTDSWTFQKLRDIADIRVSNVDKKTHRSEKPVKLCNYMDVYSNEYITNDIQFMEASANSTEIENFSLIVGDVVITKDSETPDDIGIPAVIYEKIDDLVCGYHLAIIRPDKNKLDSVFLSKCLSTSHIAKYFALHASGSTRFGLPIGAIELAEIPIPPKTEQTQIASILSTIDRAIEQTEAIIAKQQRIKTGLMQDLLTQGIDEDGNVRSEATHQFKDSVIGRIPSEWMVKKIAEAGEVKLGRQTAPKYKLGINSCPYLRVVNISENRLDLRDIKSMDFTTDEFKKYCLKPGDVLLTEGDLVSAMNVGRSAVFRGEIEGCCFQNSLIRFRPFLEKTAEYFHFAFCYLRSIGYFANATMATTVFHLSAGRLKELYLLIPNMEEQLHISRILLQQDEAIDTNLRKHEKLLALKTGLMQDLLTGTVRVTALLKEFVSA